MSSLLKPLIGRTVNVITCDGKNVVGVLRGMDQSTNLILEDCEERVFAPNEAPEQTKSGLNLVRGDNIALIGEVDDEKEAGIDYASLRGQPLRAVVH